MGWLGNPFKSVLFNRLSTAPDPSGLRVREKRWLFGWAGSDQQHKEQHLQEHQGLEIGRHPWSGDASAGLDAKAS